MTISTAVIPGQDGGSRWPALYRENAVVRRRHLKAGPQRLRLTFQFEDDPNRSAEPSIVRLE